MTDYDKHLLPVEEKSVYCSCGEELSTYEEIEDEECNKCKKIRIEDGKYWGGCYRFGED